jgi:hypothetical protein
MREALCALACEADPYHGHALSAEGAILIRVPTRTSRSRSRAGTPSLARVVQARAHVCMCARPGHEENVAGVGLAVTSYVYRTRVDLMHERGRARDS